jgi:hypothetical protein
MQRNPATQVLRPWLAACMRVAQIEAVATNKRIPGGHWISRLEPTGPVEVETQIMA